MKYKKWKLQEKLTILVSCEQIGAVETCRKYSVSTATLYSWKKKHEQAGQAGLKLSYDNRSKDLKEAERENRILRKLLIDKDIELQVQRELLKKKVWDIRSKKDLVDSMVKNTTSVKHGLSVW